MKQLAYDHFMHRLYIHKENVSARNELKLLDTLKIYDSKVQIL